MAWFKTHSIIAIWRTLDDFVSAAVTADTSDRKSWVVNRKCQLGGIRIFAGTAGTGAGNTVIDVFKNGTSVFSTAANRPTLAATATGDFATSGPDNPVPLDYGDRVSYRVASISTTGHAAVNVALDLLRP